MDTAEDGSTFAIARLHQGSLRWAGQTYTHAGWEGAAAVLAAGANVLAPTNLH